MGLGSKIKNALHSDHDQVHRTTASNTRAPGAYPSEDYLGNSDGFVGDTTTKHTSAAGPTSGAHSEDYSTSQHKKLHKGASEEEYDPYKDELSPKSATSQQSWDSGVGGVGTTNVAKDRASSGNYWGDMSSGNNNKTTTTKDLPDRSRYSQSGDETLAGRQHDPRLADQAVGGGMYNGVTGTSSHNHQDGPSNRLSQQGAVHDPLTSSTRGAPVASNNGYDEGSLPHNSSSASDGYSDRHLNGNSHNNSRLSGRGLNGHGLNGHGLNGSGLNGRGTNPTGMAGGAAAGYGAHEIPQQSHYTYGNQAPQHSFTTTRDGGVPKTSMLDPEPVTATTAGPIQHNATHGAAGVSSPPACEGSPQNSSGLGGAMSSSAANKAKNHFGPGHEGAKVLHQCEHCGNDNDISRYFRNDVVYRLGS